MAGLPRAALLAKGALLPVSVTRARKTRVTPELLRQVPSFRVRLPGNRFTLERLCEQRRAPYVGSHESQLRERHGAGVLTTPGDEGPEERSYTMPNDWSTIWHAAPFTGVACSSRCLVSAVCVSSPLVRVYYDAHVRSRWLLPTAQVPLLLLTGF